MPGKPRKYSDETIEAIWTLMCEGVGATEIEKRLASDRAGIGYEVPMPESTVDYYLAKLKRERGDPRAHIKPGQEIDAAQAIVRRSLAMFTHEQLALERRQRAGETLSNAEWIRLRTVTKGALECSRDRPKDPVKQQAGATNTTSELLTRLTKNYGNTETADATALDQAEGVNPDADETDEAGSDPLSHARTSTAASSAG